MMTSAPAINSTNGIVKPVSQSDHTGRNVSWNGRKYFRTCATGPSVNTFHTPAMKKIRPTTARAKRTANAAEDLSLMDSRTVRRTLPARPRDLEFELARPFAIDVLPIGDLHDIDDQDFVLDLVKDSEVSLPDSVLVTGARQFFCAHRARIFGEVA